MAHQGVVKCFNPTKQFGFITAADGVEIFVHMKNVADGGWPRPNDTVTFDMDESPVKEGEIQAVNVRGGTGRRGQNNGAFAGTCKWFSRTTAEKKGFGFIVGQDGTEIFFGAGAIQDGSFPQEGDRLQFDFEQHEIKGIQAANVTGGTGSKDDAAPTVTVCKFWVKGECAKEDCKFAHSYDGSKGGGKGKASDSWTADSSGPYGGGKGSGSGKGKGTEEKMGAMMEMMGAMLGGVLGGGDSWEDDSNAWGPAPVLLGRKDKGKGSGKDKGKSKGSGKGKPGKDKACKWCEMGECWTHMGQ